MKSFNQFNLEQEIQASLLEVCVFAELDFDTLNESKIEDGVAFVNKYLNKAGLTIKKSRRGLIGQVGSASKQVGQMLAAAIKGDKERIKELQASGMKMSDLAEFILNLDAVVFHVLGKPIKIIELATGWKLTHNYKAKMKNVARELKAQIDKVRQMVKKIFQPDIAMRYNTTLKTLKKEADATV